MPTFFLLFKPKMPKMAPTFFWEVLPALVAEDKEAMRLLMPFVWGTEDGRASSQRSAAGQGLSKAG